MFGIVLVPAYGRVYKTTDEMTNRWAEGKDFKIQHRPYTSIRDINALKK